MRSRMSIEYASLGVSGLLPDNTEIANGGVRKEREREKLMCVTHLQLVVGVVS